MPKKKEKRKKKREGKRKKPAARGEVILHPGTECDHAKCEFSESDFNMRDSKCVPKCHTHKKREKKKKKPAARGVPKWSPTPLLTAPNRA